MYDRSLVKVCSFVLIVLIICLENTAHADEWPQWRGPNRDGVWSETGIIDQFSEGAIVAKWSVAISSGYSGPTVADGRVYVTDRLTKPNQVERVHCFDWQTGEKLWSYTYDCVYSNVSFVAGPRASVTIHDGYAYSLGTMGHLYCFDAKSGKVLWGKNLNAEYEIRMPIWGIASAPLIEGDLLIIQAGGSNNSCLLALDRKTGAEQWRALDDRASYSAPIIVEHLSKRILVCWTGDNVVGLNPQSGELYWQYPHPPKQMVLGVADPLPYGNRLFFTGFYDGALMLRLASDKIDVQKVWRRVGDSEQQTDGLHSIIAIPVILDGYIYGVDSYGELRCLEAGTGKRVWEDLTAVPKARWSTIHFIRNHHQIWMFNERGELLITSLSPKGLTIHSRAKLIEPTTEQLNSRGGVTWSHPAFAYKHVFARNDKELVCASLAKSGTN
ncbi:PQQ-like beta-propeller repeat protein [bacterium]|nr:PQQ-like beta-propeller repeat protein [bacterium]